MTAFDLSLVLVRVTGLWFLVQAAHDLAMSSFWIGSGGAAMGLALAGASLLGLCACAILARSAGIARWICRDAGEGARDAGIQPEVAAVLGFALIGLAMVLRGLPRLIQELYYSRVTGTEFWNPLSPAGFLRFEWVASVVEILLGLGLFLGARSFARLAIWLRTAAVPADRTAAVPAYRTARRE